MQGKSPDEDNKITYGTVKTQFLKAKKQEEEDKVKIEKSPNNKSKSPSLISQPASKSKDFNNITSPSQISGGKSPMKENVPLSPLNRLSSSANNKEYSSASKRRFQSIEPKKDEEIYSELVEGLNSLISKYEAQESSKEKFDIAGFMKEFEATFLQKNCIRIINDVIPRSINLAGAKLLNHSKFWKLLFSYVYFMLSKEGIEHMNFTLPLYLDFFNEALCYELEEYQELYNEFKKYLSYYDKNEMKRIINEIHPGILKPDTEINDSYLKYLLKKPEYFRKVEIDNLLNFSGSKSKVGSANASKKKSSNGDNGSKEKINRPEELLLIKENVDKTVHDVFKDMASKSSNISKSKTPPPEMSSHLKEIKQGVEEEEDNSNTNNNVKMEAEIIISIEANNNISMENDVTTERNNKDSGMEQELSPKVQHIEREKLSEDAEILYQELIMKNKCDLETQKRDSFVFTRPTDEIKEMLKSESRSRSNSKKRPKSIIRRPEDNIKGEKKLTFAEEEKTSEDISKTPIKNLKKTERRSSSGRGRPQKKEITPPSSRSKNNITSFAKDKSGKKSSSKVGRPKKVEAPVESSESEPIIKLKKMEKEKDKKTSKTKKKSSSKPRRASERRPSSDSEIEELKVKAKTNLRGKSKTTNQTKTNKNKLKDTKSKKFESDSESEEEVKKSAKKDNKRGRSVLPIVKGKTKSNSRGRK
jgi:hypothetical protein